MGTIQIFLKSAKAIVTLGASVNTTNRQNIINVVNDLNDELTRAVFLADSYLRGARVAEDDTHLISYLRSADSKLMQTYLEHHVCAGIYSLRDRLKGIFDPAQYSIDVGTKDQVVTLIGAMSKGERVIIDDLQDIVTVFRDYADQLEKSNSEDARNRVKANLAQAITHHRNRLSESQKQIKRTARQIIDKL